MKWMMAVLIVGVVAGCAHLPESVQMQDGEIEGYRAMALRALNSPEAWREHQVLMRYVERKVDPTRRMWFEIKPGNPPMVTVWIPTVEANQSNSFAVFEFDHSTHTLKGIALGSMWP